MSESQTMLVETAERLFADLVQTRDADFSALWQPVAQSGFPLLLVPAETGGFGGSWDDACLVTRLAGYYALPLPVGEAVIAGFLERAGGLQPIADGFGSLAPRTEGRFGLGRFSGLVAGVPWGRDSSFIVAQLEDGTLLRLETATAVRVEHHISPAEEPRDTIYFEAAPATVVTYKADLGALGALLRAAQIAGALDAALALSVTYANQRVQFGKPLARFQAIQQSLAFFAEEAAAANCAARAAFAAMQEGAAGLEIAYAKLRANRAVGAGTAIAHQVHGAIGITREHGLHHLTRRLLGWRSEFGNDRFWSNRLGRAVAAAGADNFWTGLTG